MENISNIVNNVLDARGWRGRVLEQMAVELWPEVVGEQIAFNTLAEKYRGGTLYVRARSPQWVHEMHFHSPRIVARLNGRLRAQIVQKVVCRVTPPRGIKVGALKPNWEDPSFPERPPLPRNVKPQENDEASQRAHVLTENIDDAEMRAVMERLIAASIRVRDSREAEALPDTSPRVVR